MKQFELAKTYREIELKTADPGRLIVLIYKKSIKNLEEAQELLEKEKHHAYDRVNTLITKTQTLIAELTASLNKDSDKKLYESLLNLYSYFNKELREANFAKDATKLTPIIRFLQDLLGAWEVAVKKACPENSTKKHPDLNIVG